MYILDSETDSVLFFTVALGPHEAFAITYLLFIHLSNPQASSEIVVHDSKKFEYKYSQEIEFLRQTMKIKFTDLPAHLRGYQPNSMRFCLEPSPEMRAEFVYIGDVDIVVLENALETHKRAFSLGYDYSNIVREGTTRLTGLHFTKWSALYPLPDFQWFKPRLEERINDEMLLFEIVKKNGYSPFDYQSPVGRPTLGLHLSLNRLPFFAKEYLPDWGIDLRRVEQLREITNSTKFQLFSDISSESTKRMLLNLRLILDGAEHGNLL